MANLFEVLVTCDCNNTLWTCAVWDPHTGTNLMTYKGGGTAEPRTFSFVNKDYVAIVEKGKPILHIWPINSQQTVQGMRFVLPGKASSFAISSDGAYFIAGIDEKIYVWQISSGALLTIINRHYQKIVLLKFTPDGQYFVSAAEDGMVMVWSLVIVTAHPEVELVTQTTAGQHDPVYVFSDHSLPVTDFYISKTGMHGRLCTVSSDRTCKIYNLSSGELLLNIIFDVPLLSTVMDVLELNAFVGTADGKIHQFSLTNVPRARNVYVNNDDNLPQTFVSHSKGVTCLSVSLDGETLMSGSNDELVILWHIRSRQPIRTLRHKGPITNALFTVNNPSIFNQDFKPSLILHNLERTLVKDSDNILEMEILTKYKNNFWPQQEDAITEANQQFKEYETEFTNKEANLKEEIQNLMKINADLYAFSIQRALEIDSSPLVVNKGNKKKKVVHKNK